MVKKRINELPALGRDPAAGDLVHLWDGQLGKSTQVDVADLPGTGTGGGGGGTGGGTYTTVASPFFVTTLTANYSYDGETNSVTIRDERLLNKIDYPVLSTQIGGGEFFDDLLTYHPIDPDDDSKGSVTISNFQLDGNAHITVIVPGERDAALDTQYAQLLADVALLKQIAAPLMPNAFGVNYGKMWWTGGLDKIPAGWQECVAMRGLVPVHYVPDDADFTIGHTGGSKMHTNTVEEMVPHDHEIIISSRDFANYADSGPDLTKNPAAVNDNRTFTTEKSGGYASDPAHPDVKEAKPYSIMNPYMTGVWIEFVGVD